MSIPRRSALSWLWLSLIILIIDQWTKQFAVAHLAYLQSIKIVPFFNITLSFNKGAAFSFLEFAGGWQRWLFILIAILMSVFILGWLSRISKKRYRLALGLSLILGGAFGNLWDRFHLGYVIDFVDWYVKNIHWPIFNIADMAICIGVFLIIIDLFFEKKKNKKVTIQGRND